MGLLEKGTAQTVIDRVRACVRVYVRVRVLFGMRMHVFVCV